MILRNRLFERKTPDRDSKSIYIFSEGLKREYQYFQYFKEVDSRINIEVYELHAEQDNSPLGLLSIAEECIIKTEQNPNPKYDFCEGDQVWIVLDTDPDKRNSRLPQIAEVRIACSKREDWFFANSNPCFEVWLHYHLSDKKPFFEGFLACSNWKKYVNTSIRGGFDSRKHPLLINDAVINAEKNYSQLFGEPKTGTTNVYKLGRVISSLLNDKLQNAIKYLNK